MSGGAGLFNPVLKGVVSPHPSVFLTFCHLVSTFLTLYRRGTLSPFSGFPDILSENVLIPNPVLKGVEFPRLSVSLTFSQRMCGFLTLYRRGWPYFFTVFPLCGCRGLDDIMSGNVWFFNPVTKGQSIITPSEMPENNPV